MKRTWWNEIQNIVMGRGKQETRSYRCPFCRGWHLTSTPDTRRHV